MNSTEKATRPTEGKSVISVLSQMCVRDADIALNVQHLLNFKHEREKEFNSNGASYRLHFQMP